MKKVLILVVSSQNEPYAKMVETANETWNSIEVEDVETVFYFSEPVQANTETEIYFPLPEVYQTMGEKMLLAFAWSLGNRDFDYIARVNSSTYVNKKKLIEYVQTLPDNNLASGLIVKSGHECSYDWMWGLHFILSKDIVKKIVQNRQYFDHSLMEDVALGKLTDYLKIPLTSGTSCTIDRTGTSWRALCYGSDSFEFLDFMELQNSPHHFYRCKQDGKRWVDEWIMNELFRVLN